MKVGRLLLPGVSKIGVLFLIAVTGGLKDARAAEGTGSAKGLPTQEEDYTTNPFTEYGEYNSQNDEDEEIRFLQHGRLFGVSVGGGAEGNTGNRGNLWNGGFPLLEIKLHYWFTFNLALDMGFFTVKHFYDDSVNGKGHVDVRMNHLGVDLKYYFDTKDLAAPLSFANPYLLIGVGTFTKSETSEQQGGDTNTDTGFGLNAGVGLEFVVAPKKCFFEIEGKIHSVSFSDTNTDVYSTINIPDLTGLFWTATAGFLFTW